jgi:hypothetical protein
LSVYVCGTIGNKTERESDSRDKKPLELREPAHKFTAKINLSAPIMQEQLTQFVYYLHGGTAEKCRRETAFYLFAAGTPAVQLILRTLGPQ